MTDCASLTGNAAAGYGADNVQLVGVFRQSQRLTNDQLQGLQTKVFVNASAIDGDSSGTGIQANSCNRILTSAGAIVIFYLRFVDLFCSLP